MRNIKIISPFGKERIHHYFTEKESIVFETEDFKVYNLFGTNYIKEGQRV